MSEEYLRMLLVVMMVFNYPLLKRYNAELTKPLGLVFDSPSSIKKFLRSYPFASVELSSTSRVERLCALLTDPTEDQVFLLANRGSREGNRMLKMMQILVDAAVAGSIEGATCCQMPVALFLRALPLEYEHCFFVINLEYVPDAFDILKYLPLSEEIPLIEDNIKKIENDGEKSSLCAAIEFCRLRFYKEGKVGEFSMLLHEVDKVLECYENRNNTSEIVTEFISMAFKWRNQAKPNFINIEELKRKDGRPYRENMIPYSDEVVYLPADLMKQLLKSMSDLYAIDTIRQTLRDEKLLLVYDEEDPDYSVKISVGAGRRKRFYRLDSNLFEDKQGMPFLS